MPKVYVGQDGLEVALRKFKKDTVKSGILYEIRLREYFRTPKEKREFKAKNFKKK